MRRMLEKNKLIIIICIMAILSLLSVGVYVYASQLVKIQISQMPNVDIILTKSQTQTDLKDFEKNLKKELVNQKVMSQSEIDRGKVNIQAIDTQIVESQEEFKWQQDISSSIGSVSFSNNGKDVVMNGNPRNPGKNAIWIIPEGSQEQDFEFGYNIDYGDSFNAAGMLLRVQENENGTLEGYMISFNNSGSFKTGSNGSLWHFIYDKNNNTEFQNGTDINLISNINIAKSGNLKINVSDTEILINGGGLSSEFRYKFEEGKSYGEGYGFFSDHYSHGCDSIGSFRLTNINLKTEIVKKFTEVLQAPDWREGSSRILVDVEDNENEQFADKDELNAIIAKLMNNDVYYIGWGTSKNRKQMENLIQKNDGKGTYVENSSEEAIQATVNYIKKIIKPNIGNTIIAGESVKVEVTSPVEGVETPTDQFPNGVWKVMHDDKYYKNPQNQYELNGIYTNELIKEFNNVGKYYIYCEDKLVTEVYAHRRPVSSFNMKVMGTQISLKSTSYDLDIEESTENTGIQEQNKGIKNEKWEYKDANNPNSKWKEISSENVGKEVTVNLEENTEYMIKLTVTDYQGVENVSIKYITTTETVLKPIASFRVTNRIISMYNRLEIIDESYDPSGMELTYNWTVTKDGETVYTGSEPLTDFSTENNEKYGKGTYKITLLVSKMVNEEKINSDEFSQTIQVIEDTSAPVIIINPITDEKQREDINISANIRDQESGLKFYQYVFTEGSEKVEEDEWSEAINIDGKEKNVTITLSKERIDEILYLHIRATNMDGTTSEEKVTGPYYINPYIVNLQVVDKDTGIAVPNEVFSLTGEKSNGQTVEIVKEVATDSNGKILVEKAKIKDVVRIKIENIKEATGYQKADYKTLKIDTSTSKIIVDKTESSQDLITETLDNEQTIKIKVPVEKKKFDLEIKNIDAKTSNYISGSEFIIKENGNEIAKGVTEDGKLTLNLPIAGIDTKKEYVLEQTKVNEQYNPIDTTYLKITFDSEGNVSNIAQRMFAENKHIIIEDEKQSKIIVKNDVKGSQTFNVNIQVNDYFDNKKPLQGSMYKVKVEGENNLNYTTQAFVTDSKGNIQIDELYGEGMLKLTFIHQEAPEGYKIEDVNRYITIDVKDNGQIEYNQASMEGVFDKIQGKTVYVKLNNVPKSSTNTIRIKINSKENRNVGVEGIDIKIVKAIDNSVLTMGTTDENGYVEINNVVNDGIGEVLYKVEIENDALGMTPIFVIDYQKGKITNAYQMSSFEDVNVSYLEDDDTDYYKHVANIEIFGELKNITGDSKLFIEQQSKENGEKIQGAQYKIKMIGDESIYTKVETINEEGKIEIPLLKDKNLKIQITQTKAADGYKLDSRTKTIMLTKNVNGIYEINSVNNIEKETIKIDDKNNVSILEECYSNKNSGVRLKIAKTDMEGMLSLGGFKFRITEKTTGYSQEIITTSNGYATIGSDFIATEGKSYVFNIEEIEAISPYQLLAEPIKIEVSFTKNGEIVTYNGINYLQGIEYLKYKSANYDAQNNEVEISIKIKNMIDPNITSGFLYDLDIEKVNKDGKVVSGSKYDIEIRPYAESSIVSKDKLIDEKIEVRNLAIKEDKTTILLKETNAAIGYGLDSQIKVVTLKIDSNGDLVFDEETTSKDLEIEISNTQVEGTSKKLVKIKVKTKDASEEEQPTVPEQPDQPENPDEERPAEERPEDATVALKVFNKSYGDWTKTYEVYQAAREERYNGVGVPYYYYYWYYTQDSFKLDSAQKLERIFKDTAEAKKYGFEFISGSDITLETRLVQDGVISNEIYETSKSRGNTEINDKNGTDSIYLYKDYANKTVELTMIQNVPAYNYKRNTTSAKVIVKFDSEGKIISGQITQGTDTEDFAIGGISAQGIVDKIQYLNYLERGLWGTESGHRYTKGDIKEYNSIGQDTIYLGLLNKSLENPLELSVKLQDADTNDGLDGEVSAIVMEKLGEDKYKPLAVQNISIKEGIGSIKLKETYANRTLRIELLQTSNGRKGNIIYENNATVSTQFEVEFNDNADIKEFRQVTKPDNVEYNNANSNKIQYTIFNSLIYNFGINVQKLDENGKPLQGVRIQTDSYYITDKNTGNGAKIFSYGSAKTDENGNVKLKIVLPEDGSYKYHNSTYDIVLKEYYVPDNYKAIEGIKIRILFGDTGEVIDTQIISDYKDENTVITGKNEVAKEDMERSSINIKLKNEQVDAKPVMEIRNTDSEDNEIKLEGTQYKISVWDEKEYAEDNLTINETRYSSITDESGSTVINFENAHALRTMIYKIEEVKTSKSYQKNDDILVKVVYDKDGKIVSTPEFLTKQTIYVPNVGLKKVVELEGNPIGDTLIKLNIINELKPAFTIKIYRSDLQENIEFNNKVFKATSQIKKSDGAYENVEEERFSLGTVKNYTEIGFKTKHTRETLLYKIYEETGTTYTERGEIEVSFDEYGNVIHQETSGKYITSTNFGSNSSYINTYIASEQFRLGISMESNVKGVNYSLAGYTFDVENSKGEHSNITTKTDRIGNVVEIVGEVYKGETIKYKIKPIENAIDYEPVSEIELTVVFDEDGRIISCTPESQEGIYNLVTTNKDSDTKINMSIKMYVTPSERTKINMKVQDDLDNSKNVHDVIYEVLTEKEPKDHLVVPEGDGSVDIGSCQNYKNQTVIHTLTQISVEEKYMINDNKIQISVTYDSEGNINNARIIASDGYVTIDEKNTIGSKELSLVTKNRLKTNMQVYNISNERETDKLPGSTFKIIQKGKSDLYSDTKITDSEGKTNLYVGPYYISEEITYEIRNTIPSFGFEQMPDSEFTLTYDNKGNVIKANIPEKMKEYMSIEIPNRRKDKVEDIIITIKSQPLFTVGMKTLDSNTNAGIAGGKYEIVQVDKATNKGTVITENNSIAHASVGKTEKGKTVVYNIIEKQAPLGYKYKNKDQVIGQLEVRFDGEGHIIEGSPRIVQGYEYISISQGTTDKPQNYDVDLQINYEEIEELNIIIENQNIIDNKDKIQSTFNAQLTTGKFVNTTTDPETGLGTLGFGKITAINSRQTLSITQSQIQGGYAAISNIRMSIVFDESGKIKEAKGISGEGYATPNETYTIDQVGSYTIKITVKNNPQTTFKITNIADGANDVTVNGKYEMTGSYISNKIDFTLEDGQASTVIENVPKNVTIDYMFKQTSVDRGYNINKNIMIRVKYDNDGKIISASQVLNASVADSSVVKSINYNEYQLDLEFVNKKKFEIYVDTKDAFNENTKIPGARVFIHEKTYSDKSVTLTTDDNGTASTELGSKVANSYLDYDIKVLSVPAGYSNMISKTVHTIRVYFGENGDVIKCESNSNNISVKYGSGSAVEIEINYIPYLNMEINRINSTTNTPLAGRKLNISSNSLDKTIITTTNAKGKATVNEGKITAEETVRYTISEEVTVNDTNFEQLPSIDIDVTYDNIGNIANIVTSDERYGTAIKTGDREIEVTLGSRKVTTISIINSDYYNHTVNSAAQYEITSDKGETATVSATTGINYEIAQLGKVYSGEKVTYTIHQKQSDLGYEVIEDQIFTVQYNADGTINSVEAKNNDRLVVKEKNQNNSNTKPNIILQLFSKPTLEVKFKVTDKLYNDGVFGIGFKVRNEETGEEVTTEAKTDKDGYLSICIPPTYENKNVKYTITQTNTYGGYNTIDPFQIVVSYGDLGTINEKGTYVINGKDTKITKEYSEDLYQSSRRKGIQIEVTLETEMGIGIQKQDVFGNNIKGIEYVITAKQGENIQSWKDVTNTEGTISKYIGSMPKDTVVEYTISELQAPAGYRKIEDIVVKVYFGANGRITSYVVENEQSNVEVEIATDNLLNMENSNEAVHLKFKIINDNRFTLKVVNQDNGTQKPIKDSEISLAVEGKDGEIISKTAATDKKGEITLENIDAFGDITIYFNQLKVPENYSMNSANSGFLKINKSQKEFKLTYIDGSDDLDYTINNETGVITIYLKNDNNLVLNVVDIDAETGNTVNNAEHVVKAQYGEENQSTEEILSSSDNVIFDEGPITTTEGVSRIELGNTYNIKNKKVIYTISTPTTPDNEEEKYESIDDVYIEVKFDEKGLIKTIRGLSSRVDTAAKINDLTMNVIIAFGNIDNYKIKIVKEAEENGKRINGAVFDIKIEANNQIVENINSQETGIKIINDVTIEEGIIELRKLNYEGKLKVTLTETQVPDGYEGLLNMPIDIEFSINVNKTGKDDVEIEVEDITSSSSNARVEVNNITREIEINVTNKPTIQINIDKTDENGNHLKNMQFDIVVQKKDNLTQVKDYGTFETNDEGIIQTSIDRNYKNQSIFITLTEHKTEDFQEIAPITIEAEINEKGEIENTKLISGIKSAQISNYTERSININVVNKLEEDVKPYEINITKINENDENLKISNVIFQVKVTPNKGTSVYKAVSTDENGNINIKGLVGSENIVIELREIEAPEGYELGDTQGYYKYEIYKENGILKLISANTDEDLIKIDNNNKSININVPNKTQLLGLAINKLDKKDMDINIANAKFRLTDLRNGKEYTSVTDNKGIAYFGLEKVVGQTSEYELEEIEAPNGYKLDNTRRNIAITIDQNGNISNTTQNEELEILEKNKNYIRYGVTNEQSSIGIKPYGIKIINTDQNNKNTTIPNAEFNIKIHNTIGANSLDTSKTTDENGCIQIANVNGAGEIEITLKNTIAGLGYQINNNDMKVKLNRDSRSGKTTVVNEENVNATYDEQNNMIVIYVGSKNNSNQYSLVVNMVNKDTNELIRDNSIQYNININGKNIQKTANPNGQIILAGLTIPDVDKFNIEFEESQGPSNYESIGKIQKIDVNVSEVYENKILNNINIIEGEDIRIVRASDSEIVVNLQYTPKATTEDNLYLSSDIYRVTDNYVERVSSSTTVRDYLSNMKSNGEMKVYDKDGNIVEESKYVGTGMTIETVKGDEKITKTISVIGDVTGDGEIKALDISKMKQHLIGKQKLEGEYLLSADITDDGEVKALDISKVKQAIIGKITL